MPIIFGKTMSNNVYAYESVIGKNLLCPQQLEIKTEEHVGRFYVYCLFSLLETAVFVRLPILLAKANRKLLLAIANHSFRGIYLL